MMKSIKMSKSNEDYLSMINPKIIDGFGEKIIVEKSKTSSEDLVYIPKAFGVIVSYQDQVGEKQEKIFVGEESLSIQYEIDSLLNSG